MCLSRFQRVALERFDTIIVPQVLRLRKPFMSTHPRHTLVTLESAGYGVHLKLSAQMFRMHTSLVSILVSAAVAYAVLCALLYFRQSSFIFFPGPNDSRLLQQLRANRFEIAGDGASLEGWWIDNPGATSTVTILYFGGNAEDVLATASTATQFNARHMVFANYRGYGGSTGRPGQQALYDDALALYDFTRKRGVSADQIVVMGRSLGTGVASMLAAARPVRAAVLVTPFDSLAAVAARHYRWFPVRLLLKHPFPSIEWAGKARAPALFLAAKDDDIVPATHAQKLFEAWQGPKWMYVLDGADHNNIEVQPDYLRRINEFLLSAAAT